MFAWKKERHILSDLLYFPIYIYIYIYYVNINVRCRRRAQKFENII
jgi:hypothetical protein